jgi:hypothetical protein
MKRSHVVPGSTMALAVIDTTHLTAAPTGHKTGTKDDQENIFQLSIMAVE